MREQMIEFESILGRATQGVTRPYICSTSNGDIYFVKGRGAGKRSLMCEWIAAQLAQQLGLPIAPFDIAYISESIVEERPAADKSNLGVGLAFASKRICVNELKYSEIAKIPVQLQRDTLAFDWWIRNDDRNLTAFGGNPNLFLIPGKNELVIIDHNLAFADDFCKTTFLQNHVFAPQFQYIATNPDERARHCQRFTRVMEKWQDLCATLPIEWQFVDEEQTIAVALTCESIEQQLETYKLDNFWDTK